MSTFLGILKLVLKCYNLLEMDLISMKYNKLTRIKIKNKLYDIFSDENHCKFFLEVKLVDGKEKYYYVDIKTYYYLNKIYNCKNNIMYLKDKKGKRKLSLSEKLYVSFGIAYMGLCSVVLTDKIIDAKLQRNTGLTNQTAYTEQRYDISETSYLNDCLEDVTFSDLRKTLMDNSKISLKYKEYINRYIDLLEERLPKLDLRIFNENLKKLSFEVVDSKDWEHPDAMGYIRTTSDWTIITLKSEYGNEYEEWLVISHELTHMLRGAYIKTKDGIIKFDFNFSAYGEAFKEAFTEVVNGYIITDDYENYFNEAYRSYTGYDRYSNTAFQILKLADTEYTMYDFFNYGIDKFEELLRQYNLDELIDLYDVDMASENNNITVMEKIKIDKLERQLLDLVIENELKKGTSIEKLYCLADTLAGDDYVKKLDEISKYIQKHDSWQYCIDGLASDIRFNEKQIKNPSCKLYSNGEMVYKNQKYSLSDDQLDSNLLYVVCTKGEDSDLYKIVRLENGNYIDVTNNQIVTDVLCFDSLYNFINFNDYNLKINIDNFLKMDFVFRRVQTLKKYFYYLDELIKSGESEFKIYQEAKSLFGNNWVLVSNFVLDKNKNFDWCYRLTDKGDVLYNKENVLENGNAVLKTVEYTSPSIKVYIGGNLIYEDLLHRIENGKIVNTDLHIVKSIEDGQYKLVKIDNNKYIDILSWKEITIGDLDIPLTILLDNYEYNMEINLESFILKIDDFYIESNNLRR